MKDRRVQETRICAKCGASFRPFAHSVREGRGRFCSKLCGYAAVTSHGETAGNKTPEYRAWRHMLMRCQNKSDPLYGGRGITVCDQWASNYTTFLSDMGRKPTEKHSLDRIDPDGNYEPSNCRWATPWQQSNNRRRTVWVEFDGERMTISAWADRLGLKRDTLKRRLNSMPAEKALTAKLFRKPSLQDPEWFKRENDEEREAA